MHDDSFSQSFTPQRIIEVQKRQSPTADLRHSFDKALDEADHQDINQLSVILNTEEYLDGPNFGTNVKGLETDASKNGQEKPDLGAVPTLSQFKQSINFEFGMGGERKDIPKQEIGQKSFGRPVLGEIIIERPSHSHSRRTESNYEPMAREEKENVVENSRGRGRIQNEDKKEKREESAEKWKGKFLKEKERLQQTIELLEKANEGYFTQVSEKSGLVNKLNEQRQMNEGLLDKFNR